MESAVFVALHNAKFGERVDSFGIPLVPAHVAEGGRTTDVLILQEAVEHHGNLCAGNVAVGAEGTVRESLDIA